MTDIEAFLLLLPIQTLIAVVNVEVVFIIFSRLRTGHQRARLLQLWTVLRDLLIRLTAAHWPWLSLFQF